MVVEALPRERKTSQLRRLFDGFRTKLNDMLDDSRVFRRRSEDVEARAVESRSGGNSGGSSSGITVPASAIVGFIMYLIAQTAGGIWWAATVQAKVDHDEQDRSREEQRLWDSINNYHLEINALRLDIARVQSAQSESRQPRYKGD